MAKYFGVVVTNISQASVFIFSKNSDFVIF